MSYGLEYLHTSSKYIQAATPGSFSERAAQGPSISEIQNMFDAAIRGMEAREAVFCHQFGVNTFEELIGLFKRITDSNDIKIMGNFNAKALEGFTTNVFDGIMNEKVTVKVNIHNLRDGVDLREILEQLEAENVTVDCDNLTFDVAFSIGKLKQIVNAAQRRRKFRDDADYLENPTTAFINYLRSEDSIVTLYPSGSAPTNEKGEFLFRASPFNYSASELKGYTATHLAEIIAEMKKYVFNTLGINRGSDKLQVAATIIWNSLMAPKVKTDVYTINPQQLATFFAGGGGTSSTSWLSNTKGAMGEFQTAVFYQYLALNLPGIGERLIARIVGSDVNAASEYLHTDVQILDAFGIQVKNFGSDTVYDYVSKANRPNTIKVSLHPSQVPTIASDADFMGYIINAQFNKSVNMSITNEQWQHVFDSIAPELFNLHYDSTINIPDKITAYHISGHLVPGSHILRMAKQNFITKISQNNPTQLTVKNITITGTGYPDEQFLAPTGKNKKPRFLEWWSGTPEKGYTPTSANSITSWDSKVSIRTVFEYGSLLMENFKLF